jgi:hypothetical protein
MTIKNTIIGGLLIVTSVIIPMLLGYYFPIISMAIILLVLSLMNVLKGATMIMTTKEFTHQTDSSALIVCPNDDCSVGRTSLDHQLSEDGMIECEWCGSKFRLKMEVININES